MTTKTRRRLRATVAAAVTSSLIGLPMLAGTANATTPTEVTWTPSAAPAGTGFWSNGCPTTGSSGTGIPNDSSNLHKTLLDDQKAISASMTPVPENGTDVGWQYTPAGTGEGGPSFTLANPTSTTSIAATVRGPSTGHAMVFYQGASASDYYMGIAPMTSTSGWAAQTATTFTWYHWSAPNPLFPNQYQWTGMFVPLFGQPTPKTVADFANTAGSNNTPLPAGGTWYASVEYGCTGSFAIDHIQVTDATGVTDYDLQTPTSTTTATSAAARVAYGSSTTISTSTTSTENGVTTTNPAGTDTLESSTDGGTTWTTAATGAVGTTFPVKPTRKTLYRVQYAPTAALNPQPSTSPVVTVAVLPLITISASSSRVNVGRTETFTAKLQPALANATVTFAQASGTSWVSIGTATTNSSGIATLAKSRSTAGSWRVRATVSAQPPGYDAATSSSMTVGVYQPVSISAYRSTSSVYIGYSFRIYGTVSPRSSGIPLQLQQYVGGRWIIVATGRTGTRGAYSLTKVARSAGTATFRVIAPASGYRLRGGSTAVKVTILRVPYTPPPPPPPSGGGGGGGSGIG